MLHKKKRNLPCTVQESEMRGCGHGKADVGRHSSTGESSWAAQSDIQEALKIAGAFESVGHAPHLHLHFMTALHWRGERELGPQSGQGTGMDASCWWCLPQGLRDGLLQMKIQSTAAKQHHHTTYYPSNKPGRLGEFGTSLTCLDLLPKD